MSRLRLSQFIMKSLAWFLKRAAVLSIIELNVGCSSFDDEPKKKVVGPGDNGDISGLPWNRPRSFENATGMARALPQSR